jgi:hypothetical protein
MRGASGVFCKLFGLDSERQPLSDHDRHPSVAKGSDLAEHILRPTLEPKVLQVTFRAWSGFGTQLQRPDDTWRWIENRLATIHVQRFEAAEIDCLKEFNQTTLTVGE